MENIKSIVNVKNIQISVIIPAYNAENFISQAIDSVLRQTLKPLEIIVVNDGSTDNTNRVLDSYRENVVYIEQINSGVSAARNKGIKKAKGNWLAFLDADDYWESDKLEKQVFVIQSDTVLVHTAYQNEFLENRLGYSVKKPDKSALCGCSVDVLQALFNGTIPNTCSVLARTADVVCAGMFDGGLNYSEDYDLWIRLAGRGSFMYVDDVLTHYRHHSTQATAKRNASYLGHMKVVLKNENIFREILGLTVNEFRIKVAYKYSILANDLLRKGSFWLSMRFFLRSLFMYPPAAFFCFKLLLK